MKWIGLTGGLASGKSEVTRWLRQHGYQVADADELARQALGPGSPLVDKVIKRWGQVVLGSDGQMDRNVIAQKVFSNSEDLQFLESLIHPWVQDQVRQLKEQWIRQGCQLAFYDVPLLFEKNLQAQFDFVVLVFCSEEQQIARALARDKKGLDNVMAKLRHQISMEEKKKLALHVIDNSKDLTHLKHQLTLFNDQVLEPISLKPIL